MNTMVLGVAGGTGSGKTTLTKRLKDRFGDQISVISHDNYVAFFHRHMNSDDIYRTSGAIRAIPISDYDTSMQIGYIESTKYKLSNADRAFLEILKAAVRHSLQDESFAASDQ